MSGLRRVHRGCATVVALYALVHLANHLAALGGVARHTAFLEAVRSVTRVPALEALLLACVTVQAGSGLVLLLRRRAVRTPRPPLARLQAWSGAYLAFFLLVHVGAVLGARFVSGLDTNFHFAAAGLHVRLAWLFFVPYYGLAVAALGVHLGAALALAWPRRVEAAMRLRAAAAGGVIGAVVGGLVLAALGGLLYPVRPPPAYLDYVRAFLP